MIYNWLMLKRISIPFYPFNFAIFPILTLLAYNVMETRFTAVIRPLVISILACGLIYGLSLLIFHRDWHKSALVAGLTILLFYSYGHVFNLVQSSQLISLLLGRHRLLISLFGLIWLGSVFVAIYRDIKPQWTNVLNAISIFLVAFPMLQIGWFYLTEASAETHVKSQVLINDVQEKSIDYFPDIYYIILDTYTRPDVLLEDYDINVTDFVAEMEDMGFYFARESQSNYGETFSSLTSSLNMQYISTLAESLQTTIGSPVYQNSIKNNIVRRLLEERGYMTIAFSTGYRWSEITDSDIFYFTDFSNPLKGLTSFEELLFKTTILYPFRGLLNIETSDSVFGPHISAQRKMIEILPEIPDHHQPTFTFAHFLVPHVPYIFDEDGSLLTDPGYYSGENNGAINGLYRLDGYKRQVLFINDQIESIVKQIIEKSEEAPIIIIQGDHGFEGANRYDILNMYYFPDQNYNRLYDSITPVNSFRVILSQYFGLNYSLLTDRVYKE